MTGTQKPFKKKWGIFGENFESFLWLFLLFLILFIFVINSCLKKVLILEGRLGNDWDLFVVNLEMMENWGLGDFFGKG